MLYEAFKTIGLLHLAAFAVILLWALIFLVYLSIKDIFFANKKHLKESILFDIEWTLSKKEKQLTKAQTNKLEDIAFKVRMKGLDSVTLEDCTFVCGQSTNRKLWVRHWGNFKNIVKNNEKQAAI